VIVGPVDIGDWRALPDFSAKEQGAGGPRLIAAHGQAESVPAIPSLFTIPPTLSANTRANHGSVGMESPGELVPAHVPWFMPWYVHRVRHPS
jgi:hypothetical protein